MKGIFLKFLSRLMPARYQCHASRQTPVPAEEAPKAVIHANLQENVVDVPMNQRITVTIHGKNNTVIFDKEAKCSQQMDVIINGDNNVVKVRSRSSHNMSLLMGSGPERRVHHSSLTIGERCWAGGVSYVILENDTHISIGNNCLISTDVLLRCSDSHSILNEQGEVINMAKSITIGDRVWIAEGAKLLKKAQVPDGCIVGAFSVVTRKFDKPNCVLGGNPAKVIKENVQWRHARPDLYYTPAEGSKRHP